MDFHSVNLHVAISLGGQQIEMHYTQCISLIIFVNAQEATSSRLVIWRRLPRVMLNGLDFSRSEVHATYEMQGYKSALREALHVVETDGMTRHVRVNHHPQKTIFEEMNREYGIIIRAGRDERRVDREANEAERRDVREDGDERGRLSGRTGRRDKGNRGCVDGDVYGICGGDGCKFGRAGRREEVLLICDRGEWMRVANDGRFGVEGHREERGGLGEELRDDACKGEKETFEGGKMPVRSAGGRRLF